MGWEPGSSPSATMSRPASIPSDCTKVALSFGGFNPETGKECEVQQKPGVRLHPCFRRGGRRKTRPGAGAIISASTIADTISTILPTGICTYEHVVSPVDHEKIVAKAIEVRA